MLSNNSQADFIGLIFAKSKRQVNVEDVCGWLKEIQPLKKPLVGVFVNEKVEEMIRITEKIPLSIIQCHGNETKEYIEELKSKIHLPIWKAIHHGEGSIAKMKELAGIVDGFIIDSKVKGHWGGTGISFNWEHIPEYIDEARKQQVPCFIAGGVTPENANQLLTYQPDGIDLASGIEEEGSKSKRKIQLLEERVGKS